MAHSAYIPKSQFSNEHVQTFKQKQERCVLHCSYERILLGTTLIHKRVLTIFAHTLQTIIITLMLPTAEEEGLLLGYDTDKPQNSSWDECKTQTTKLDRTSSILIACYNIEPRNKSRSVLTMEYYSQCLWGNGECWFNDRKFHQNGWLVHVYSTAKVNNWHAFGDVLSASAALWQ